MSSVARRSVAKSMDVFVSSIASVVISILSCVITYVLVDESTSGLSVVIFNLIGVVFSEVIVEGTISGSVVNDDVVSGIVVIEFVVIEAVVMEDVVMEAVVMEDVVMEAVVMGVVVIEAVVIGVEVSVVGDVDIL